MENTTHELWEHLDIIDRQIADLRMQQEQLDAWFREAGAERAEILRELSRRGVEVEYA